MKTLTVDPDHLENLASKQDQAKEKIEAGPAAADGIGWDVWWSHGLISVASNVSVSKLEAARRAAGDALKNASVDLAANLRKGKEKYRSTDEELGENLDKQMLHR
jgi:hypothetical protein